MLKYKKIAVKIGSNVLTQEDGQLDLTRMQTLVDQLSRLHQSGVQIILISSGAVAAGRSELAVEKKLDIVEQRQLFSTIGQVKLVNHYSRLFAGYGITIGQVLTTKTNFEGRVNYLNQRNCIRVMLENGVIPVVNENDAVSVSELMFTDNDELSGLIASMMSVDALIILSNIDGIFDGQPGAPGVQLIREVKPGDEIGHFIQTGKSEFGRGGMKTKASISQKIAAEGIDVYIANGKRDDILLQLADNDPDTPSTRFVASESDVSSVKKWIAHSDGFVKGEVLVDKNAADALCSDEAVSLLPVGILKISGRFEKDDIIKIVGENHSLIGWGKAQYSSEKAKQLLGKKGQKPLVHYDYLFLQ